MSGKAQRYVVCYKVTLHYDLDSLEYSEAFYMLDATPVNTLEEAKAAKADMLAKFGHRKVNNIHSPFGGIDIRVKLERISEAPLCYIQKQTRTLAGI